MKVQLISVEDDGPEGFFSEDGKFLGGWSPNDATWRGEYFDHILAKVGLEVIYPAGKTEKSLRGILLHEMGYDEYGYEGE